MGNCLKKNKDEPKKEDPEKKEENKEDQTTEDQTNEDQTKEDQTKEDQTKEDQTKEDQTKEGDPEAAISNLVTLVKMEKEHFRPSIPAIVYKGSESGSSGEKRSKDSKRSGSPSGSKKMTASGESKSSPASGGSKSSPASGGSKPSSVSGGSKPSSVSGGSKPARAETQKAHVANRGDNKRFVKKPKGRHLHEIDDEVAHQAATKIQAVYRGWRTRRNLSEELERVRGSNALPNLEDIDKPRPSAGAPRPSAGAPRPSAGAPRPSAAAGTSGESKRDSKREYGARDKEKDTSRLSGYIDVLTINCDAVAARKSDCEYSKTTTSCRESRTDDCGFAKESACSHLQSKTAEHCKDDSKDKHTEKCVDEGGKEAKEKHRNKDRAKDACLDDFKSMVFKAFMNAGASSAGRDRCRISAEEPGASGGVTSVCSSTVKSSGKSQSSRKSKGQSSDDGTNHNRSANESSESSFWDEDKQSNASPPPPPPPPQGNNKANQEPPHKPKSGYEDDGTIAYLIKCNFESAACNASRSCRFSNPDPSKYGRPGESGLPRGHCNAKRDGDSRDDRFSSYRIGGDDFCKRFATTCSDLSCDALRLTSREDGCKDIFKSVRLLNGRLDDCGALGKESDDKLC